MSYLIRLCLLAALACNMAMGNLLSPLAAATRWQAQEHVERSSASQGFRGLGGLKWSGGLRLSAALHLRAGSDSASSSATKPKKKKKKATKAKAESRSVAAMVKTGFKKLRPATRLYITGALALTLLATFGIVNPNMLALDPMAALLGLQFWRPLTSALFLGGLNMQMATSLYFLGMYGQELEKDRGTADYVVFLLTQVILLSVLAPLLGMPYTSSSVVSAALWVSCRRRPMQKLSLGVMGISMEAWLVPFGRMLIECLQAQNPIAALPHMLGFVSGHFYHFTTRVWPLLGGKDWLQAPPKMKKLLNGKAAKKGKKKGPALKKKKKKKKVPSGPGHKLGGSATPARDGEEVEAIAAES